MRLTELITSTIQGANPASGKRIQKGSVVNGVVHDWRSAVLRLKCWLEWWFSWAAQRNRTSWEARCHA